MLRRTVTSSSIESIGYDEKLAQLEIKFKRGGLYRYLQVPAGVYAALMLASSHGTFHAAHIKDKYPCAKLG